MAIIAVLEKCIRRNAPIVGKSAKYLSNHQRTDPSTAEIASPSADHHEDSRIFNPS